METWISEVSALTRRLIGLYPINEMESVKLPGLRLLKMKLPVESVTVLLEKLESLTLLILTVAPGKGDLDR
jgi:hypothetical protein